MSKLHAFDDGSSIEWINRETLKYGENGFSVSIWVDFEAGLFKSGRIIRASSLKSWTTWPDGSSETISTEKRNEILAKVRNYYQSRKVKSRVEA
jgi:hypothetical protein